MPASRTRGCLRASPGTMLRLSKDLWKVETRCSYDAARGASATPLQRNGCQIATQGRRTDRVTPRCPTASVPTAPAASRARVSEPSGPGNRPTPADPPRPVQLCESARSHGMMMRAAARSGLRIRADSITRNPSHQPCPVHRVTRPRRLPVSGQRRRRHRRDQRWSPDELRPVSRGADDLGALGDTSGRPTVSAALTHARRTSALFPAGAGRVTRVPPAGSRPTPASGELTSSRSVETC
jgi:hypothetical protein